MYDAKWDLKQSQELIEMLRLLDSEVRLKTARRAAGRAMAIVTATARANALAIDDPRTARQIAANIVQRPSGKYAKRTGDVMIRVGVLGGARNYEAYGEFKTGKSASGNPGGDTFYWRFHEFGTSQMKAHPILLPALESNVDRVEQKFTAEITAAITRLLRK